MIHIPSVAICIPTFNQAAYLATAAESAFAQTYSAVEVWISDDCSTDNTEMVVEQLLKDYPKLHYYRQGKNLGITKNNNWVLSQPQTDYIVRLDSDDVLWPSYVEKLVSLLLKHSSAAYAHCAVQEIDEAGHGLRIRRLGGRPEYQGPEEALRASTSGYRVAANICMFRSETLYRQKYYQQGINFAEDWELSVRIADAGEGNCYSSETLASYRVWRDVGNLRTKRKLQEIEGCSFVYKDALEPAFQKRGWDLEPIIQARRRSALGHSAVLCNPIFTAAERGQLIQALRSLGGGAPLERRLTMYKLGLGPLLAYKSRLQLTAKDAVKSLLLSKAKRAV